MINPELAAALREQIKGTIPREQVRNVMIVDGCSYREAARILEAVKFYHVIGWVKQWNEDGYPVYDSPSPSSSQEEETQ